jgi:ABC-type sugar transport system permease subunit
METQQSKWTPIVYLGPAVFLLFVLMVYPSLETVRLSFLDRRGNEWVGLENYDYAVTSPRMQEAFGNNLVWLIVFTFGTVGLGLLVATLADRVRYESLAKAVIFMPMAISFVGAGVIWKFVYDLNPPGNPTQPGNQIGILNAILVSLKPDDNLAELINRFSDENIDVSVASARDTIVAAETEAIQQAVADETLTQPEADELLAKLPDTARDFLNGQLPPFDEQWQLLGRWANITIDTINAAIAESGVDGQTVCEIVPHVCAREIEDVEEAAIGTAVDEGRISEDRGDEMLADLQSVALSYVREGQRPSGGDWQTVDQWDDIITNTREINVRTANEALDTGFEPVDWIRRSTINNIALIVVGVWIWTGFCMVVLSAGLKSVPKELLEAARVDGANEFQAFFRVTIPVLMPTITVVTTTMIITVLKVFDIVYVMTAGNFGTEVIANRMYLEMYGGNREFGRASAIAVILMLAIIPLLIYNIYQFRKQEAAR